MDTFARAYEHAYDDDELPFWARGRGGVFLAEVPVREGGRLPSFFIIGAAKAGTTSLHHYLGQHPEISMCPYKEPHFFSADVIHARGLDWYKGLFAGLEPTKECGDASTSYSRCPRTRDTPRRIHDCVPDAKLVYLVREPVARTRSDCLQALKYERYVLQERTMPASIDVLLERNPLLVRSSEYIEQIESYLRYFDREQLLVVLQEDLAGDPLGTLRQIFEFLEVDPSVSIDVSKRHNATDDFMAGLGQERVMEVAGRVPAFDLLKRIVPASLKEWLKLAAARHVDTSRIITPMSAELAAELGRHFRPFNRRLAELIGRDLSHWDR